MGGDRIVLAGDNLGPLGTLIDTVEYGWVGGSGLYQGDSQLAKAKFVATNCSITVAHSEIQCVTAPGVGSALIWRATIGGQIATPCPGVNPETSLTSSYASPELQNAVIGMPPDAGSDGLPTEGGTVLMLCGSNFGPPGFAQVVIDTVAIAPFVHINNSCGYIVAPPGVGIGHVASVICGGQASNSLALSYAPPSLLSVTISNNGT